METKEEEEEEEWVLLGDQGAETESKGYAGSSPGIRGSLFFPSGDLTTG